MKFLLIIALTLTSCATMTEKEWKQKRMLKTDRKMMKKVWRTRRFAK
jgi:hypothetical protein